MNETDCINLKDHVNDYDHVIPAGMTYIKGNVLERMESSKHSSTFQISKKPTFFYKESAVYLYLNLLQNKNVFMLEKRTMIEILCHVEEKEFQHT